MYCLSENAQNMEPTALNGQTTCCLLVIVQTKMEPLLQFDLY